MCAIRLDTGLKNIFILVINITCQVVMVTNIEHTSFFPFFLWELKLFLRLLKVLANDVASQEAASLCSVADDLLPLRCEACKVSCEKFGLACFHRWYGFYSMASCCCGTWQVLCSPFILADVYISKDRYVHRSETKVGNICMKLDKLGPQRNFLTLV